MAKFRKKPIIADAVQATERGTIHTIEGNLFYEPGDWIITGAKGEKYSCADEVFQATYDRVCSICTSDDLIDITGGMWACDDCGNVDKPDKAEEDKDGNC